MEQRRTNPRARHQTSVFYGTGTGCRGEQPRVRRREKNVLDIPSYRTGDISLVLVLGEREADVETRRNALSPQHADERRMEVRAVAMLGFAGPHRVTASPA